MAEEAKRVSLSQSLIEATLQKGAFGVGEEANEETWIKVGVPGEGCQFAKIVDLHENPPPPTRRHVQEQEGGSRILRKLNKKPSFFSRLFKKKE